MTTYFYTHPSFLAHDTGSGHPESAYRLRAIAAVLKRPDFATLHEAQAPRGEIEQVRRVHPQAYIDKVLGSVPQQGRHYLDPDTPVSPGSGEAALHAVGAVCAAVDAVFAGEADNAFCGVRPPGHHAEAMTAMGFCLFNNIAIAAEHARHRHDIKRVAIIDFDVHHGNGTQHIFTNNPEVLYASTHQYPWYPGTGSADETGVGNLFNAPLAAGSGSKEFRAAMSGKILPAVDDFQPELILISAGFDAHEGDPLSSLKLIEDDYAWITRELLQRAERHCAGRLVSALEGGYNLEALGESVGAHVRELMYAKRGHRT
ncbi:MAG: histone deacetylase family protein [Methylococcaceae bacterium]|nr:histone deacetylase family protein [Methylococcaceae bacterium]